ncbi:MAG TPA: hypothetical protein DDW65_17925 [Firmicutes bacterium]|jgi:hypothetical protein|nr:hypothetical protein [Bacillota bacterium]
MSIPDLTYYWTIDVPAFVKGYDYQPGVIPHHFKLSMGWPEEVKEVAAVSMRIISDWNIVDVFRRQLGIGNDFLNGCYRPRPGRRIF